jgi:hypothetical protein
MARLPLKRTDTSRVRVGKPLGTVFPIGTGQWTRLFWQCHLAYSGIVWTHPNTEWPSRNSCRGKALSITYFSVGVRACKRAWVRASVWVGGCARASSLTYPARNAHAPYCHLWPPWLHHILRHYLLHGTIFGRGGGE